MCEHLEPKLMNKTPTTRYTVTLEAPSTPSDQDGIQRLKRWLKRSWRDYALKCVDIGLAATKPASANADTTGRSDASAMSGQAEASDAADGQESGKAGKARPPP